MKPLHYIQLDNATPLHPMALWDGAVAQSVTHNTDSHFCILWNTHATFVTEKKNIPPSQKVTKISETGLINRKRATSLEKAIFSCLLPCQNIARQIKHRSVIGENAQFIRAYITQTCMPGIVVIPVVLVFPHSGHPKMAKCEFSLQKWTFWARKVFWGLGNR